MSSLTDVFQRRDTYVKGEGLGLRPVIDPDLLRQLHLLRPDLNLPSRPVHVREDPTLAGRETLVKRSLGAHNG